MFQARPPISCFYFMCASYHATTPATRELGTITAEANNVNPANRPGSESVFILETNIKNENAIAGMKLPHFQDLIMEHKH